MQWKAIFFLGSIPRSATSSGRLISKSLLHVGEILVQLQVRALVVANFPPSRRILLLMCHAIPSNRIPYSVNPHPGTPKRITPASLIKQSHLYEPRVYRNLSGSIFPPPHLHIFILAPTLAQTFDRLPLYLLEWQINEATNVLKLLERKDSPQAPNEGTYAFSRDPTILMWERHITYLKLYLINATFSYNQKLSYAPLSKRLPEFPFPIIREYPSFLNDTQLHNSHKEYLDRLALKIDSNYDFYFPPVTERPW